MACIVLEIGFMMDSIIFIRKCFRLRRGCGFPRVGGPVGLGRGGLDSVVAVWAVTDTVWAVAGCVRPTEG